MPNKCKKIFLLLIDQHEFFVDPARTMIAGMKYVRYFCYVKKGNLVIVYIVSKKRVLFEVNSEKTSFYFRI